MRYICHFSIPDSVPHEGEIDYHTLAKQCAVDVTQLKRNLRYAMTNRIFYEPTPKTVAHTIGSLLLKEGNPMRASVQFLTGDCAPMVAHQLDAIEKWGHGSQEPNQTAVNAAYGGDGTFFDFIGSDPVRQRRFGTTIQRMIHSPASSVKHVQNGFDWASLGKATVIDVGGHVGYCAVAIAEVAPPLRVIVQERPEVVAMAEDPKTSVVPAHLKDRVSFQVHDFFQPQKTLADVYFYRKTLLNHTDKHATNIIRALSPALKPGNRLLIMDFVQSDAMIQATATERYSRAVDLQMMLYYNSGYRTLDEWKELVSASDSRFEFETSCAPPGSNMPIISFIVREVPDGDLKATNGVDVEATNGVDAAATHEFGVEATHGVDVEATNGVDAAATHEFGVEATHGVDGEATNGVDAAATHEFGVEATNGVDIEVTDVVDAAAAQVGVEAANGVDCEAANGVDAAATHEVSVKATNGVDGEAEKGVDAAAKNGVDVKAKAGLDAKPTEGDSEGSPARKDFSVAIVGGGLGGLSLAIGLIKRGVPVQVYEGASEWTDAGAGVVFARNSIEAMKRISPDIHVEFSKHAAGQGWASKKTNYMDFRDGMTDGDLLTSVECRDTGQQSVHRTLFAKDMVALLPEGTFHMGKRMSHLENRADGGYTLRFADGSSADADAIVGGDGIRSRCRQILLGEDSPEAKPQFAGEFAYRGMVPMEKAVEVLGDEFARNSMVNVALDGLTTSYPVEQGRLLNIVAARSLDKWDHDEWVVPSNKKSAIDDFAGYGPLIQRVISLLDNPFKWALYHHPQCSTFYKGRFALIGDAAHATTPHQGAGCGQAFEDALILCSLLADDKVVSPAQIEDAFAAYDAVRRPRALKIVSTSRENGEICMLQGEKTGRDFGRIKKSLDERFQWIWYEDFDQQMATAKDKLYAQMGKHQYEDTAVVL
ncbi:MAG: hypothetical protein L6R39_003471 [Caloplaca ligustica]|nr:MAG: hypothetical protein L6R39_003471 [Caloplaca ligustica]